MTLTEVDQSSDDEWHGVEASLKFSVSHLLVVEKEGSAAEHAQWDGKGSDFEADSVYLNVLASEDGPVSVAVYVERRPGWPGLHLIVDEVIDVGDRRLMVGDVDQVVEVYFAPPGPRTRVSVMVDDLRWPESVVVLLNRTS